MHQRCHPQKQKKMAENQWMFSGRYSKTERTDEWEYKTDLLVKELARGSKSVVRPLCPCARCEKRHRESKDEMTKHLWQYGYWTGYVTSFDFSQYERDRERDRGEVMRQRINGIEYDGVRNLLDDLRDADMPDSPPLGEEPQEPEEPEEPGEPEEPEPTAKAFLDSMSSAKRPLYEGAKISQYDAISQALADKARYSKTRAGFEADLKTYGNMLPEGHCLPKSLHEAKKLLKGLSMDYEKIDCCPKGCLLFWKQFKDDKYCTICRASRYHEVTGADGQVTQTKVAVKILRYLSFIKRIQRVYLSEETATQMT